MRTSLECAWPLRAPPRDAAAAAAAAIFCFCERNRRASFFDTSLGVSWQRQAPRHAGEASLCVGCRQQTRLAATAVQTLGPGAEDASCFFFLGSFEGEAAAPPGVDCVHAREKEGEGVEVLVSAPAQHRGKDRSRQQRRRAA